MTRSGRRAHPTISLTHSQALVCGLLAEYRPPKRIRTDNGLPFASNARARLTQLSVWFTKLGIYPELTESREPQVLKSPAAPSKVHWTLPRSAHAPGHLRSDLCGVLREAQGR